MLTDGGAVNAALLQTPRLVRRRLDAPPALAVGPGAPAQSGLVDPARAVAFPFQEPQLSVPLIVGAARGLLEVERHVFGEPELELRHCHAGLELQAWHPAGHRRHGRRELARAARVEADVRDHRRLGAHPAIRGLDAEAGVDVDACIIARRAGVAGLARAQGDVGPGKLSGLDRTLELVEPGTRDGALR